MTAPPARGPVIPTWMLISITALAVVAIWLTTDRGRRVAARVGLPNPFRGGVDRETRRYLLDACGGDRRAMTERLDGVRSRFPELDEAAVYRRAIRAVVAERGGPSELEVP